MIYDVVVGNPPFGSDKKGSSRFLHYMIMKNSLSKCRDFLCFIMPSKPITVKIEDEWLSMFKSAVCTKVDVVGQEAFPGTQMDKTAIYYCDRKARKDLYDKQLDMDDKLYRCIDEDGHRTFIDCFDRWFEDDHKRLLPVFRFDEYRVEECRRKLKKNKFYLNLTYSYACIESVWITDSCYELGIRNYDDELEIFTPDENRKQVIECYSVQFGKNLQKMFKSGLVFKYALWLTQNGRSLTSNQFKYVPDLDYSKIDNDTDLLLACGFTSDEARTVLDYLKSFDFTQNRNDMVRDCS